MKLSDESGNLRLTICFLNLFINHGLRDYLITALPSIIVVEFAIIEDQQTSTEINNETVSLFGLRPNHPVRNESSTDSPSQTSTSNITLTGNFNAAILNVEEGWTPAIVGLILSIIHWTWAIALILGALLINPEKKKIPLVTSLFISGGLAMLTEVAAGPGPVGIGCMRALQGLSQGLCYPLTYYILRDLSCDNFVFPYFIIFLAPWLGSAFGILFGGITDQYYLGSYIFGSLCFLLAIISLFSPLEGEKLNYKSNRIWKEILTSFPVWSCIFVNIGTIWALHTFLIGISFTLFFEINNQQMFWSLCILVLIGGITTRLVALGAKYLMRTNGLSSINRRRIVITSGNVLTVVALMVNGTVGLDSPWVLRISSLVGICGGIGFSLVGARLNLHDLSPSFPIPILNLTSFGAAVGAAIASIMFPTVAQVGINYNMDNESYKLAWMIAAAIVILSTFIYIFAVSVNPLPYQIALTDMNGSIVKQNGDISTIIRTVSDPLDLDIKSFKSLRSGLSFKTAVSRPRTRTGSFRTVDENFHDVDLRSIADTDEDQSVKTAREDAEELEIQSIKSGTSFRSIADDNRRSAVLLDVNKISQTQDWLRTARNTGKEFAKEVSMQKKMVEKNILMAVQW